MAEVEQEVCYTCGAAPCECCLHDEELPDDDKCQHGIGFDEPCDDCGPPWPFIDGAL